MLVMSCRNTGTLVFAGGGFTSRCVVCMLLLLSLSIRAASAQVTFTQNVTGDDSDITVFPSVYVQFTCETTDTGFVLWRLPDGSNRVIVNIDDTTTLGDFSIAVSSVNGTVIVSTATIRAASNVTLSCLDDINGNASTISLSIKPIVAQVMLTQNITNDDSNITVCPGTPVAFICQTTTGVVVWSLGNGPSSSLTSEGETSTLGNFVLQVTNVTQLLLLVESTATGIITSDISLTCSTGSNGLSSTIAISVRDEPQSVPVIQILEVCHDQITLNWTAIDTVGTPELDSYRLSVSPQPLSSDNTTLCSSGQCTVRTVSAVISGLQDNTEYTFSVNGVNCGGNGMADRAVTAIEALVPTVPILHDLSVTINTNSANPSESTATIFAEWLPGDISSCLQSPIDSFLIIVSGVLRDEVPIDGSLTNTTLNVPACGVSAVTITAINGAGMSVRSDPQVFTGSQLSLVFSATAVDSDSVTLSVTITQCLRDAVDNITITYRNVPDFGYTRTVSNLNESSVTIKLTDLEDSTTYNATVVVYYRENNQIRTLGPQTATFTTTQSFFSFQEAVIAGLATGFAISLIIMALLIVFIFVFCYKFKVQNKRAQAFRKTIRKLTVRQKEIETDVGELREQRVNFRSVVQPEKQPAVTYQNEPPTVQHAVMVEDIDSHTYM